MPDTPETVFALDYGRRRIGVAVGQQITDSASPLAVVRNGENGPEWNALQELLDQWRPQRLVVGMPFHADGSASEMGDEVKLFLDELKRFNIPIETIDERFSSQEAEQRLKAQRQAGVKGRISKEMIDAVAATLIAERWLKKEY